MDSLILLFFPIRIVFTTMPAFSNSSALFPEIPKILYAINAPRFLGFLELSMPNSSHNELSLVVVQHGSHRAPLFRRMGARHEEQAFAYLALWRHD